MNRQALRRKPKLPLSAPAWAVGYSAHGEDGHPEWLCAHGVGHGGVHTCDGCCSTPEEHGRAMREYEMRQKGKAKMHPKEYAVLERAVEDGVAVGWNHAHKHVEHPEPNRIQEQITQEVLTAICEWFDFPENTSDDG